MKTVNWDDIDEFQRQILVKSRQDVMDLHSNVRLLIASDGLSPNNVEGFPGERGVFGDVLADYLRSAGFQELAVSEELLDLLLKMDVPVFNEWLDKPEK